MPTFGSCAAKVDVRVLNDDHAGSAPVLQLWKSTCTFGYVLTAPSLVALSAVAVTFQEWNEQASIDCETRYEPAFHMLLCTTYLPSLHMASGVELRHAGEVHAAPDDA